MDVNKKTNSAEDKYNQELAIFSLITGIEKEARNGCKTKGKNHHLNGMIALGVENQACYNNEQEKTEQE